MKFIIEMLSGEAGRPSSKRGVMIWFVLLFTFVVVYNITTGKTLLASLQDQLFQVLCLLIVLVFGEKALKAWALIKGKVLPPDEPNVNK